MANKTSLDLSQFKAPGVYTVEFDNSEYTTIETNTLRLIVGFSRKGVYNRPVLISNKKEAISVYGDIDTLLESRGSFFHRSMFAALNAGPILALALLPTNNGQSPTTPRDLVEFKSFSVAYNEKNSRTGKELYSSFFDKELFWKADTENFKSIVGNDPASMGKYLSITNLGQKSVSILIRKYKESGFDITAREFYGAGNVPSFVEEFDYLSDYFVEVLVIEGDWENSSLLESDPTYSAYFNSKGLKKESLESFLGDSSVKFLGRYRGTIIPNFIDGNGVNRSIDTIINQGLTQTGLFAMIDKEALQDYANKVETDPTIDMVGHSIAESYLNEDITEVKELEFLSYRQNLTNVKTYSTVNGSNTLANTLTTVGLTDVQLTSKSFTDDKGVLNNQVKIKKPLSSNITATTNYTTLLNNIKNGTAIINGYERKTSTPNVVFFSVTDFYENNEKDSDNVDSTYLYLTVRNKNKKGEGSLAYTFDQTNLLSNTITLTSYSKYSTTVGTEVYFKPKTSEYEGFYAKIKTATVDNPNNKSAIEVTGLPKSLSAMSVSNVNYEVVVGDYHPLQTVNTTTLNYTLSYSPNPNHLSNVTSGSAHSIQAYTGSNIYKDYESKILSNGDKTTTDRFIKYETLEDSDGIKVVNLNFYTANTLSTLSQVSSPANGGNFTIHTGVENIYRDIPIISGSLATNQKSVKLTATNGQYITKNDYLATRKLVGGVYKYYITKVLSKVKNADGTFTITTANEIYIKLDGSVEYVIRIENLEDFATQYSLFNFEGFNMTSYHLPGNSTNKQSQLIKILGVLDGTNLYKALTDNNLIQFRYIVDTFDGGLANNSYPKNILTRMAKDKKKCLAIMNAPSIKEFKNSTNPRFTDEPDPANGNPKPNLKIQYIKDGGNLALSPSIVYSLPTEEDGSKYSGFFINYPTFIENGREFSVPPAAFISNLYVNKFKNGSQYEIVAGKKRGAITVTGGTGNLEHRFSDEDRGYLAEIGLNPIVFKPGVGPVIFDNLMAYQKTRSAFNNLSLRDLLITIEDGIEQILEGYLFEFNDDTTRAEIDRKVRSLLQGILINRGISAFSVQIDSKNNPNEIIDQQIAILDVEIEPTAVVRKFVNRITIQRTGGIASSGFAS